MSDLRRNYEQVIGRNADRQADTLCTVCIERDAEKPRKSYPGFDRCWTHMARSQRHSSKAVSSTQRRFGIYHEDLSSSMQEIKNSVAERNETHKLYDTSILEELQLARVLLITWLRTHKDDDDIPLKDLLECTNTVTKIAKLALDIQKADQNELSAEQRNRLVTLVSQAFHRANVVDDPAQRAIVFTTELSRSLSGKPEHTIDVVAEPVPAGMVLIE